MADSYRGHIPDGTGNIAGLTGEFTRTDATTRSARQISPLLGNPEQDPLPNSNGVKKGDDDESNILFVDGLPTDCTRREVSHLFRPFVGFKDIKVVHKEPRKRGDKGYVLCFVEFADTKCARTALEALNGYQFDVKKPGLGFITLHFAKFPFCPPGSSAAT